MADLPVQPVDEFFSEDLCVEAVYQPETGDARVFQVIFDRPSSALAIAGMGVESLQPQALCRDIDVYDATHACTLTIGGETWKIIDIQPDGTGVTTLILSLD